MIWDLAYRSAAILAVFASASFADCPKRVDGVNGILLTRTQPFFSSLYKATATGLSESRVMVKGGATEEVSATYLHALAPQDRISAKNTVSLHYTEPVAALDDLPRTKVWQSAVSVFVGAVLAMEGTVTMTLIGTDEVSLGPCHYPVWKVEDRLVLGEDDGTYFLQYYAPELGLVVASIKMGADGKPINGVQCDTIEIGQD